MKSPEAKKDLFMSLFCKSFWVDHDHHSKGVYPMMRP